jgi:eukaryotic-like serine/threonine-protein kinase
VPVPKVIDFGIAKATEGRLTDKTIYTQLHQFIGTPAYMSPEQAMMTSLDIDTRSDIYSLGVLLYELLTGRPPFDPRAMLAAGLDELRRTIREQEPPRPSTRLSTLPQDALTTAAKRRSTEAPKLIHAISGDLDWIVMKCLEKDRTRRYDTANGLAADLRRHLNSEPINARPPSALYTFQKLVRRNRVAFAAGSAVAAAVVIGLGVSTTLFLKERQSLRRAVTAEESATTQAQRATVSAEESRQRLLRMRFDNGARLLEGGDLMQSLPWLMEAFKVDQGHPEQEARHRLRLASVLQQCPRPRQMWFHAGTPAFAISPDGKLMVTGTRDGTSALWDVASGRQLGAAHCPPNEGGTLKCGFSANGRSAFFHGEEDSTTALVWTLGPTEPEARTIEFGERIRHSALSMDGRFYVICGEEQLLTVWDVRTGELVRELPGVSKKVDAPTFISGEDARSVFGTGTSASNQVLVAVDRTGFLGVWDVASGELLAQRRIQPVEGRAVRHRGEFSPDGRLLLQPEGYSGNIPFGGLLWNTGTGKLIATLKHDHHVHDVAFSPDGSSVVTSSQDHTARIWDTKTGALRGTPLQHREAVHPVAISPSGHLLVTACDDHTARIWNMQTGQPVGPPLLHAHDLRDVDFSIDDATVVTSCRDGSVRVWDLAAGPKWWWAGALDSAEDVFFLNGPLDIIKSSRWGAVLKDPKGVSFLGLHHSQPRLITQMPETKPRTAAASQDGERILIVSQRGGTAELRLWSTATSQPLGPAFSLTEALAAVSGDALTLLVRHQSKSNSFIQIWNAVTGKPAGARIKLPVGAPEHLPGEGIDEGAVQISPDGATVSAVAGHRFHVWNSADGQERFAPVEYPGKIDKVALSRDGRSVALAGKGTGTERFIQVWNLTNGHAAGPRFAQGDDLAFIGFDNSGTRVITAAAHQARVWDISTGQPLAPIMEASSTFNTAQFGPDDRTVIGASDDGTTRIWDANTAAPLIAPLRHGYEVRVGIIEQRAMLLLNQRMLYTFSTEPRCWEMPSDTRSLEQWERIASLLSARRLDANGTLALLDPATLSNLWSTIRSESSGDFSPSLARRYDWNIWRAELCMAAFDPASALPHLNELVTAEPERIRFRSVRARANEALQHWREAGQDLRVATRLAPDNVYLLLRLAGAELASGDAAAYRTACDTLSKRRPAEEARDAMKSALIVACYGTNSPDTLARLAAQLESVPRSERWTEKAGLAFRQGRYQEALALLTNDGSMKVLLFRAMAHHALGHHAEAREWLEKARGVRLENAASPHMLMTVGIPAFQTLHQVLFQEAQAMIK